MGVMEESDQGTREGYPYHTRAGWVACYIYLGWGMMNCTVALRLIALFNMMALNIIAPMASGPRQKRPIPNVRIVPKIRTGQ